MQLSAGSKILAVGAESWVCYAYLLADQISNKEADKISEPQIWKMPFYF